MTQRHKPRAVVAPPGPRFLRGRGLLLAVLAALAPAVGGVPAAAAGTVYVSPGESMQALVNANPAGTKFIIEAGVHRRQRVIPKDGNSFIGQPGAVLDGEGETEFAIGAGGEGVTVRGLVIRDYAPELQEGVIRLGGGAYDWLVEDNEVLDNSGVGIVAGSGWQVRGNYVHHQGQLGIKASGNGILFQGNEVAYNNTDGIDSSWEAGGSKFVHTRDLVVRDNFVHDNNGPGLWTDGNNIDTLYEGNRVVDNDGPGIFHEISYDAVIRNNLIEGNGFGRTGWIDGAGILVGDSPNVEIYGNTVSNNNDGIAGKQTGRGSGDYGPYQLKNLWVHDNVIVMDVGQSGIVRVGGLQDPVWSPSWNNRFDYNTYVLGTADRYYAWDPWYVTTTQWRAAGQDTHGTWTDTVPPAGDPPSAPKRLQVRPASRAVTVRWAAPISNGGVAVEDYLIQYRQMGTSPWILFDDGVSTARRARVDSLTNGVRYEFRVAAENDIGMGPWSAIIRTAAGVPTQPTDLEASSGVGRVRLTWEPPAADGGADITNYVVRYRRDGTTAWVTFRDGVSTAVQTEVTGLTGGLHYQFKVAAQNSRGAGVWSAVVEAEPRG